MSLVHPLALLWFLPLAAGLVLLYMLRMKRHDFRVPALFLWPKRTEDVRANSFFQKPRFSPLFWLQLLVLALLTLALAKPQIRQEGLSGGVTVFVLDTSASMSATDVRPSRFGAAQELVRKAIETLRPGERIALIEAGPEARVVFPLQNDPANQKRLLSGVEATDADADLSQALRLAAALVGTRPGARIVLLSDGVADPIRDFSPGKAQFVFQAIGTEDRNARISALGVRDGKVYVEAENTGGAAISGQLKVEVDGRLLDSQRLTLGPGQSTGKTLALPSDGKTVSAQISVEDLLRADNFAFAPVSDAGRLRVLLITQGNLFLERALVLDPRVTLDRATALPLNRGVEHDVVFFDAIPETPVRAPRVVNFGAAGSPWLTLRGAEESATAQLDLEPQRILAGVDLTGVFLGRTQKVELRAGAESVADSTAGPLVVRTPNGLVTTFALLESDFPLTVGFPIFIANLIDALSPQSGQAPIQARPGRTMTIATNSPATLITPSSTALKLVPNDGTLLLRTLNKVGSYTLETREGRRPILVSMSSPTESRIAPQTLLETSRGPVVAARAPDRMAEFVLPILIVTLIALAAEWAVFIRKS